MQLSAGLYGFIIVSEPDGVAEPFVYDKELSIILKDWYHASTYQQSTGLSSIPFGWIGEPQVTNSYIHFGFVISKRTIVKVCSF
jgi:hypothetical protein